MATEEQYEHQDRLLGRLLSVQSHVTSYWRNHPEQRLGQAIVNALGLASEQDSSKAKRLFYMSDNELYKELTKLLDSE